MKETMDWMWEEAETVIGPGRGSVSGYESCFMLGITQLSPLDYGIEIPHWRFLSKERPELPDYGI